MIEYLPMRLAEERISNLRREAERDALMRACKAARHRHEPAAGTGARRRWFAATTPIRWIVGRQRPVSPSVTALLADATDPGY
jgi:hypothetical protein